jgi:hypothetical protein
MRSGLSEALMGIGGIFMAFGGTVVILGLFARVNTNTQAEFPAMAKLATMTLVAGAVMFGAGYLLARMGRSNADARRTERGVA